jgi:hypothetical protein
MSRVFVRVATTAAVKAVKPAKICTRRSIFDGAIVPSGAHGVHVCSAADDQRSQVALMTETLYP